MLEAARYKQATVSLIMLPVQTHVSRTGEAIAAILDQKADAMGGKYFPPVVSPVDQGEPAVPRIVINSEHGFSSIAVSQISVTLTVGYSDDWQTDVAQSKEYISRRMGPLFDIVNAISGTVPSFLGISNIVQLRADTGSDAEVIQYIADKMTLGRPDGDVYDVEVKTAVRIDGQFFKNVSVTNYRDLSVTITAGVGNPVTTHEVTGRGVQIFVDYNDKVALGNNQTHYRTSLETAMSILDRSFETASEYVKRLT